MNSFLTYDQNADWQKALLKKWFYPYCLPNGQRLPGYDRQEQIDLIHTTRQQMLDECIAEHFKDTLSEINAIDLACHQGYFSVNLARAGVKRILGIDVRAEHVADTTLMANIHGCTNLQTRQDDIFSLNPLEEGQFDIVIMFGLLYHLENPVGALRLARGLTKQVLVIETQVVPHLSGMIDWGSYEYVRPLKGCFGIIDELDEVHAPEASVTGICLAPSTEGLLWILRSLGFSKVSVLPVPAGGYEQLKHGKRVMVAAYI